MFEQPWLRALVKRWNWTCQSTKNCCEVRSILAEFGPKQSSTRCRPSNDWHTILWYLLISYEYMATCIPITMPIQWCNASCLPGRVTCAVVAARRITSSVTSPRRSFGASTELRGASGGENPWPWWYWDRHEASKFIGETHQRSLTVIYRENW